MASSSSQADKHAFFTKLESLDDQITTDSEDSTSPSQLRKKPKINLDMAVPYKSQRLVNSPSQPTHAVLPVKLTRAKTDNKEVFTAKNLRDVGRLGRTRSEPGGSSNTPLSTTSNSVIRGIFEAFTFYFFPNNDVAKVRRLRIQSAIAQGATWSRTLDDQVSHIIVDSGVPITAVEKALSDRTNTCDTVIVKDKWLIESLSHKSARDPNQARFQVKGLTRVGGTSIKVAPKLLNNSHPKRGSSEREKVRVYECAQKQIEPVEGGDELSKIVQELNQAEHLPFDAELDLERFMSFSSEETLLDDPRAERTNDEGGIRENRGFICMEPHVGKSDNPNNRTIEILQQMAAYYDRTGDNWRTLAYRKGITALRKQEVLVSTQKQAKAIPGIGSRLADKIEETVTTDRLARLDAVMSSPDERVLQLFMGVYGCGLNQARLWMDQGWRTLEDLNEHADITDNQKVGIEHYEDFQRRIPRHEVKQHGEVVQEALTRIDKALQGIIGGSYRRGMPDSADIDIMITHPTAELPHLREAVFNKAVPYLFQIGFLKASLATSRAPPKHTTPAKRSRSSKPAAAADALAITFTGSDSSGTKFHGASALSQSSSWRRIDLLLVPACSLGANMLYFTGNDIFNRSMRILASRKGMRLNQYGLYKNVMRGPGRVKETEGELLEGRSERRIFEILQVPWREPHERRC